MRSKRSQSCIVARLTRRCARGRPSAADLADRLGVARRQRARAVIRSSARRAAVRARGGARRRQRLRGSACTAGARGVSRGEQLRRRLAELEDVQLSTRTRSCSAAVRSRRRAAAEGPAGPRPIAARDRRISAAAHGATMHIKRCTSDVCGSRERFRRSGGIATHCSALQRIATCCNVLQGTHSNTLQRVATGCNVLQGTHSNVLRCRDRAPESAVAFGSVALLLLDHGVLRVLAMGRAALGSAPAPTRRRPRTTGGGRRCRARERRRLVACTCQEAQRACANVKEAARRRARPARTHARAHARALTHAHNSVFRRLASATGAARRVSTRRSDRSTRAAAPRRPRSRAPRDSWRQSLSGLNGPKRTETKAPFAKLAARGAIERTRERSACDGAQSPAARSGRDGAAPAPRQGTARHCSQQEAACAQHAMRTRKGVTRR